MFALTYVEIDVPSFVPTSPDSTQTFRFAIPSHYLPNTIDAIPSISSVSFTPARISLGKDLGIRADLKITFKDHLHIFNGEPFEQGTFWGKWRGRYATKLRGRNVRLIRGFVGQALEDMETRHYVVESTDGPTPNSDYTISAKDVLKFADDDRAQAPSISNGRLAGSITNSQTSITLSPAGIGDLEYPASGFVSIGGKEVMSFTRSGNSLTVVRGEFGSVAQAHDAGDRVQLVLRYDGDDVADIIYDLLTEYANVPADYITLDDWTTETGSHLGVLYARTITEPTSVKKLVSELIEQAALALYWDDRAQQIRLTVLREIDTGVDHFDHDIIIDGSLRVQDQPTKRISQIWTYYGQRDPTDSAANEDNYRAVLADVDLSSEFEYGSPEIYKIQASWIETETAASRLNAIQLSRFRDPPRSFAFDLFVGTQITPAGGYTISWLQNQDEEGNEVPAPLQVTQVTIFADRVHVEAEEMLATGDLPALVNIVFLTATGGVFTWEVPADWNDADNSVEGIGAGAGGGASGVDGGRGGGGGAYSRTNNLNLTPGALVSYRVGSGGIAPPGDSGTGTDGGDTWFGNAVFASASMGAKGGEGGSGRTGGGDGGQAADGIGDVKFSGGNGGTGAPKGDSRAGGGGGGGAAGPNGDGGDGGSNTGTGDDDGAGGGGADGGGTGGRGNLDGGQGGHNRFNFGGGAAGASGDEGGGGGGGQAGGVNGGPGGNGEQIWTQTVNPITSAGPGGGGGGAGDGARGGEGGRYGGGGGGNGGDGSEANDGADGIIVITWRE